MFIRPAIIACLCFFFQSLLPAQNWNLVNPAQESLYGVLLGPYRYPEGLRIDSISTSGADTVYWNYRMIYPVVPGQNCLGGAAVDSNNFGRLIVKKPGGEYWSTIRNGLVVKIKTLAEPGDNWPLLSLPDGNYLKGTLVGVDTLTILGSIDTVKYIELQYTAGSTGQPIASAFNGRQMVISKNYGWVRNFVLHDFSGNSPIQIDLAGHSAAPAGLRNFSAKDAWDFAPGDTIHTYRESISFSWQMVMYADKREMAVLSRSNSVTGDTVTYVFHYRGAHQTYNTSLQQMEPWQPYNDTVIQVIDFTTPDKLSQGLMPNEITGADVFLNNRNSYLSNTEFGGRNVKGLGVEEINYNAASGCMELSGDFVYPLDQYIVEGLGGVYYHHIVWGIQEEHFYPVWYRKGGQVWGTPFDIDLISGADAPAPALALTLFPNPMGESATLRWDAQQAHNLHLRLSSLSGQLIGEFESGASGEWTLSRALVPAAGLYFITATDEAGHSHTLKISVQ